MGFSLELLTQILAEVEIFSSLEEEILTRIKGSTTPQEINEDSTSEESCVFDGEQSFEQEIEEEEQHIKVEEQELQHDLSERNCAYQSFIEQWFQVSTRLDSSFYFLVDLQLEQLDSFTLEYFHPSFKKLLLNLLLLLLLEWLHWKFNYT